VKWPRINVMRHRIRIESPVEMIDSIGGRTRSWQEFATVWAAMEPKQGSEIIRGKQLETRQLVEFICRPLAGVNTKMRIVYSGLVYDIVSVAQPEGERQRMVITAKYK
jgi:SPP1 family predicted phage head-tail adaptor